MLKVAASTALALLIATGASTGRAEKAKKGSAEIPASMNKQFEWENRVVGPKEGLDKDKLARIQEQGRREDEARKKEPPKRVERPAGVAAAGSATLPTMDIEQPAASSPKKGPEEGGQRVGDAPEGLARQPLERAGREALQRSARQQGTWRSRQPLRRRQRSQRRTQGEEEPPLARVASTSAAAPTSNHRTVARPRSSPAPIASEGRPAEKLPRKRRAYQKGARDESRLSFPHDTRDDGRGSRDDSGGNGAGGGGDGSGDRRPSGERGPAGPPARHRSQRCARRRSRGTQQGRRGGARSRAQGEASGVLLAALRRRRHRREPGGRSGRGRRQERRHHRGRHRKPGGQTKALRAPRRAWRPRHHHLEHLRSAHRRAPGRAQRRVSASGFASPTFSTRPAISRSWRSWPAPTRRRRR